MSDLSAMADLVTPMAIRVAATLGIADHLSQGHASIAELAVATGAHEQTLARLMNHLVAKGVFAVGEEGGYLLTPLGESLRSDHPSGLAKRWGIRGPLGRADLSFVQLFDTVLTGEAAYPRQYQRSFWEDLSENAQLGAAFDELMGEDVAREVPDIVAAYDWGSLAHVVDVGGGNGSLLISLLTHFPALHGTLFDLPGAAEAGKRAALAAGLSGRMDAIGASFFDPLPVVAGGYMLSAILHNWDDDHASRILLRCGEAAGNLGGSVFVIERMREGGQIWNTDRDLRMLAYFGGRERSLNELSELGEQCGLRLESVLPSGVNSILKFVP